jgi:hypothetical protein
VSNLANCPYPSGGAAFLQTSGNTQLQSITAQVANIGAVFDVLPHWNIDADWLRWKINNEVAEQSSDKLLQTEAACRLGTLPISSGQCVAALSQVKRDADLQIVSIYTPKINVAQESLDAFTLSSHYSLLDTRLGSFDFSLSWTDVLKHTFQLYATDPIIDDLRNPYYSTDFKSKVNGSVTWTEGDWNTTVYFIRDGRTPNYSSTLLPVGVVNPTAGTLALFIPSI